MRPKLVALIAASSVSVGWLLASVIVPPIAKLQGLPERVERPAAAPGDQPARPYAEQLHLKLQQAPLAPVTRRNPFVFGSRSAPPRALPTLPVPKLETEPSDLAIPSVPVVTGPRLRLSGIGSTGGVRIAVISDGVTVHLVKAGETVNGYAVVEIADETVTIADASGAQWKLRMN